MIPELQLVVTISFCFLLAVPSVAQPANTKTYPEPLLLDDEITSDQRDHYLGLALGWGMGIQSPAIQASYLYYFSAQLSAGGDLTYYFPTSSATGIVERTLSVFSVNILARYVLYQDTVFRAYVLGGFNLATLRSQLKGGSFSEDITDGNLGMKIGGGVEYPFERGLLFLELHQVLGGYSQGGVAAGYRWPLNR